MRRDGERALRRFWRAGILATIAGGVSTGVHAADPQPYSVTITPSGDAATDLAAHDAATLVSLRETAPVGPFALVARARGDVGRLVAVLNSTGHYAGTVAITIAGRSLDDPGLADMLDATTTNTVVPVAVTLTPGPEYRLRHVELHGVVTEAARARFGLAPGAPAVAADVLAARSRLLAYLQDTGHAFARVDPPAASLVPGEQALDVAFEVSAGPRVDLGSIAVTGLKDVDEAYVRRRLLIHSGALYDPAQIEKAREDLASVGVFSSVRITGADRPDASGALPVEVAVTERPRHVVNLGASFSTDLGGSLNASWTDRNLFGNAEQLTVAAAATQLGGSAARQPGYNVTVTYTIPDWLRRDQALAFNVGAVKEYLDAYDRTAALAGVVLSRKYALTAQGALTVSAGLTTELARITQEKVTRVYDLVQVPLTIAYDDTGSLFDPTHGYKVSASITPTQSIRAPSATFVIAQAQGATYIDIGAPGRSVLALRALVGSVQGAATVQIPPDQRFYGGGSATVRGYKYQSIGPRFADSRPVGGTSIDAATIEFRQRFGESFGAVVFVDAGQVGTDGKPFTGKVRAGAGVGARYYTAIGPIRLDVAVPLNKQRKDEILEAYIGIGQAF